MTGLSEVRALDAADPLAGFRSRFALPEGVIYLDGNSLGPFPRATAARLAAVAEAEWGKSLIRGWNDHGWMEAPRRTGDKIAELIGARPGEVIVADSTSVNLFKLTVAALEAAPERRILLTEAGNFPTDLHVARRATALLGRTLRVCGPDEIAAAIDEDTALVVLTHVHYRSGARHPMGSLNAKARAKGTRILWDLSHSVGAIPLALTAEGTELAVGCGYKFLNGGPGAPAFLHVDEALSPLLASPIAGWLGHAAPFDFADDYVPAPGVERFLAGTPPILGLAALECGLDLILDADRDALWAKSRRLFDLFAALMAARCPSLRLLTPAAPEARGSHIAFAHPHAFPIVQALIAEGVIGDFRAPDVARFGLTPLTLGYEDVWRAVDILAAIIDEGRWRDPRFARRGRVT